MSSLVDPVIFQILSWKDWQPVKTKMVQEEMKLSEMWAALIEDLRQMIIHKLKVKRDVSHQLSAGELEPDCGGQKCESSAWPGEIEMGVREERLDRLVEPDFAH